ncbi:MAG: ABC transporter permease [Betaproteobacteria bacterium]
MTSLLPFMPVVLWTDALVFLLVAVIVVFAWYVRRHEHLLAPWRKVAYSRSGMVAAVVLAAFVAVGLLDSLHFRPRLGEAAGGGKASYSVEVLSLFDVGAAHLRNRPEKTYSAPLATHLFARETVELADGRQARLFPRLSYGGAHLGDPETERAWDVSKRTVAGVACAILLWNLLALMVTAWLSQRDERSMADAWRLIWNGGSAVPWREMLFTTGLLLLVLAPMLLLSAKYHVLGTDKVGQDVFYQALKSIRTGLVIGTLTTMVMLPFALLLGIMAGYLRGWVDDVIQYIYTTLNSIPGILLIAASVLMLQVLMDKHADLFETVQQRADAKLLVLCLILGVTSWTGLCRLLRGESLKLREMDYIQAAQAFGVPGLRIITRHLLPNVMHIVLIAVVMDFSGLVLAEAVLSYVGVGVDPTMISFGTMINSARLEMAREPMVWWSLAAAFVFMLMLVLSANLFADAVRDAFDPRIRGRVAISAFNSKTFPSVKNS